MRILQWNVWYKESPANIAKEIINLNVDVVCAQELMQDSTRRVDTAKEIAERIGYDYYYGVADTWDNQGGIVNQGNAIFSRLPIVMKDFEHVLAPTHNPPDASHAGRIYVEVTIETCDDIVEIGCVHLSYSPRFEITSHRKQEIDNLISIVAKKKQKYLLCGDLNSSPDSYTIQQLSKYLRNAGPGFEENTWTTKPFEAPGFVEYELNWRLDYIFTTNDIQVIHSEIVNTQYSDHLPVLVEIKTRD